MNTDQFIKNILRDVAVDLMDQMDRNFERKAFFDKSWPARKSAVKKGTELMVSGALRGGNKATVTGNDIRFTNSMPYASLHNEGGEIKVTQKMKSFFWAMHIKASNARGGGTAREKAMSDEAKMWRALALMKIGSTIKIPQRQFIGFHPTMKQSISQIVDHHLVNLSNYITSILRK